MHWHQYVDLHEKRRASTSWQIETKVLIAGLVKGQAGFAQKSKPYFWCGGRIVLMVFRKAMITPSVDMKYDTFSQTSCTLGNRGNPWKFTRKICCLFPQHGSHGSLGQLHPLWSPMLRELLTEDPGSTKSACWWFQPIKNMVVKMASSSPDKSKSFTNPEKQLNQPDWFDDVAASLLSFLPFVSKVFIPKCLYGNHKGTTPPMPPSQRNKALLRDD